LGQAPTSTLEYPSIMSPDKIRNNTRLTLAVAALATVMCGCSSTGQSGSSAGNAPPPIARSVPAPSGSTSMDAGATAGLSQDDQSMVLVGDAAPVALAYDAPEQYTVQGGDTLWDIAATFLRDPWYWPEVWYVNPQVENPHLIYPGDVLAMVTIDGRQRITNLTAAGNRTFSGPTYRVSPSARATPLSESITSIPYEQISAFLSKGLVMEKDQAIALPYILATRGDHIMASAGNEIYIRGGPPVPNGTRFSIVHIGDELRDPDDDKVIGYLGIYVGEGAQSRGGDPATVALTDTTREAIIGDRLLPETVDMPLNFFPKAPNTNIQGQIISVVDGVTLIGQYQVVVLNRGARNGLAPGDVLSVFQAGKVIKDRFADSLTVNTKLARGRNVTLPEEQAGTIMVFKVFDRIGYGLVMEATSDIHVLDSIRNPI
jgi:hypothetical protein